MRYDARRRDRFRGAVAAVTGLAAVASTTAAGAITGLAARDTGGDDAAAGGDVGQVAPKHRSDVVVHWKQRPRRTVVETRTVYRTTSPGTVSLGGGSVAPATTTGTVNGPSTSSGGGTGQVSPPPSTSGGSTSGGSSSGSGPSGGSPPPAPPPSAPSSGS